MEISETTKILAMIAAYTGRNFSEADILAWHEILGEYRFVDARQAVTDHYRASADWIMPAHVVEGIKRIRAERLRRVPDPDPPAGLPDDQLDRWLAEWRRRVADGELDPAARTVGEIGGAA